MSLFASTSHKPHKPTTIAELARRVFQSVSPPALARRAQLRPTRPRQRSDPVLMLTQIG